MENSKLYLDFFNHLKVTFKNASIYNLEHPAFVNSIKELQTKLETILEEKDPLFIGFTPNSLMIDENIWSGEKAYRDLARIFHFRKVKSLELRWGISYDDLLRFISKFILPPSDLFKQGGIAAYLEDEKISHVRVEELDYSQLLTGEGEEIGDIWTYLLQEAVAAGDEKKIAEVADSFENVIGQFNTEELIVNEELQKNFSQFFAHLKTHQNDKYRCCARNLLKSVVTQQNVTTESKFENMKLLISDLSEEEVASTLWEEIITDKKFDSLSFSIFSKLMEKDRHLKISTSLRGLFQDDNTLRKRPEAKEKIRALLSGTSSQFISEIYRNTLSELLSEISYEKKTVFDRKLLQTNYRFVYLNWLDKENEEEPLLYILERIYEAWDQITEDHDYEYLKSLCEVLDQKKESLASQRIYQELCDRIIMFIETCILEGESSLYFDFFIQHLPKSFHDVDTYLKKIFDEGKITPYILKALFRFHKEYLSKLHLCLEKKAADTRMFEKLCESLGSIDLPVSLIIMKQIYRAGDLAAKIKVLKSMQAMTEWDEKFALSLLKSKESSKVGEALGILIRDEKAKQRAFEKMLNIESPYGLRNAVILRNLRVIRNKDLRDARLFLEQLSMRGSLWNRRVRAEARSILENWDACQN